MLALCLLLAIDAPTEEPAYADNQDPPRIVELDYIEVNRCVRGEHVLEQVVFWRVQFDKVDKTHLIIDCGWRNWSKVALIQTDDGWAVISECDNTVWIAPDIYWSETDFDPELVYRDLPRW